MNYSEKQNNDESLSLLFLQRMCYKKSKIYRNLYITNLLAYLMFLIIQSFYEVTDNQYRFILLVYLTLTIIFLYFSKKYSKLGADAQEIFDRKLYGIMNDIDSRIDVNNIKLLSSDYKIRYKKKFNDETNKDGLSGGLRDWYKIIDADEKLIPLYCQLQNSIWSVKLAKIKVFLDLTIMTILLLILLIYFWNKNLNSLFGFLISIATILLPYTTSLVNSTRNYNNRKKLTSSINNLNLKKNDSKKKFRIKINDIQKTMYDYRKSNYLASEIIYNLFRIKYHETIDDYLCKTDLFN